jgi:hypothetical protein
MRKILLGLVLGLGLISCTENSRVKHFGGSGDIHLPTGQKLVNVTWKENQIWYLSRPMKKDEEEETEHRKEIEMFLKKYNVVLLGITASQIHEGKGAKWTTPVTILAEPETLAKLAQGHKTETEEGSEILPSHVDILDEKGNIMVRVHETAACHSYHQMANGIKVASIPTMLQFVFAYMYSGIHEDEITHLMCVAQRLVDLASNKEKRRYALLTPVDCLGTQETLIDMKKHKAELYNKLSTNKSSPEFLKYFFSYNPRATQTQRNKIRQQLRKTRKIRYESSY